MKYLSMALLCLTFLFTACKDEEETVAPVDEFANTTWQPTNTDANPATNPSGDFGGSTSGPYPWPACNLDDKFSFTDGKFTINNGGTTCETDFLAGMLANKEYSYNKTSKTLSIGLNSITVYEFSATQLKLGFPNPLGANPKNYVILLKKI